MNKYDTALILLKKAYAVDSLDATIIFRIAYQYDSWIPDKKMATYYYEKYLKLAAIRNKGSEDEVVFASTITFVHGRLEMLNKLKK